MEEKYYSVSVFIIGTEITRGIIADRHGQLIAKELTTLGYNIYRMTLVPDDGSVEPLLRECVKQSDIIILTGGLGPTSDDMTRQIVADLAKVPLVKDQEAFRALHERIGDRINGANLRQVMIPQGFRIIPNPKGTAPGFKGEIEVEQNGGERKLVKLFSMPGPPVEMHEMFYNRILPELAALSGHDGIERDEYSCFMTPESRLEDLCKECAKEGVIWGTRVQEHRISLYFNGSNSSERDSMAACVSEKLGTSILLKGDVQALDLFVDLLKERSMTVACSESCTGGLISKLLTDRPGSSEWFWGSVVSYSNEAKERLLGVSKETINKYGAVSTECAKEMALGILDISGCDIALSVTGIAGPSGATEDKPVGTICFGFASKGQKAESVMIKLSAHGRDGSRRRATVAALLLARQYVLGSPLLDIVRSWQYI
ncbi:MAG: nicotinamide-nucleotide amidohydrolase family protein [Sphaerochaetaceae bacterium]